MAFLLVKLPLGVVSFVAIVTLLTTSAALILAPAFWQWGDFYIDGIDGLAWTVDSWAGSWICAAVGLLLLFLSLNLLNGLALVWRWTAIALLGSERFAAAAPPPEISEGIALA
jgi:hypothetical protein